MGAKEICRAISGWSTLKDVTIVDAGWNDVVGIEQLESVPGLAYLTLDSVRLGQHDRDSLVRFSQLHSAYFVNANIDNYTVAAIVQNNMQLEELFLYEVPVTEDGLTHLSETTSLGRLGVSSTLITPATIRHLRELPNLRTLLVRGLISSDLRALLEESLPECHVQIMEPPSQ